jgi:putative FmdB family regulatory protein
VPTYQYACTACDHAFEQFQSFSDDALTTCPECQGRLRKVFNAVGVVFKGSGFYRTDSRSENGSKTDEASTGAAKPDSGSGGEKKESSGSAASSGGTEKTTSDSTKKASSAA